MGFPAWSSDQHHRFHTKMTYINFVSFAQAILYRGAGFDVVWPQFVAVTAIGGLFFLAALFRFRLAAAQTG